MKRHVQVPVPAASGWSWITVMPSGERGAVKNVRARLGTAGGPGVGAMRVVLLDGVDVGILEGLAHGADPDDLRLSYDSEIAGPVVASDTAQIDLGTWPADFPFYPGGLVVAVDFTKTDTDTGTLFVRVDLEIA